MKKIALFSTISILALACCKEKALEIPESVVGNRKVLVEEITGVDCPNCPDGAIEINALISQFGKNIIAVSIHGGDRGGFNKQLPTSQYNFNTDNAEKLVETIGAPSGFPAAAINRQVIDNEVFNFRPWGGSVNQELAQDFHVGLFIENKYDASSRELEATINIAPEINLTGEYRLTVYITQDSIVDAQNYYGQLKNDYVHRHVFREVLTNVAGDVISEPLNAGAVVTRKFNFAFPADFEPKHCSVVAFVHHGGSPDKEVLQAEEKHVIE